MSEENNTKIPANETIIDEITKDLRDAQFTVDPADKGPQPKFQEDSSDIPEDFDNSEVDLNETEQPDVHSEDSDDEALKNQEIDLTDEEKDVRRAEAIMLKNRGNDEFKNSNFMDSIQTYTLALKTCPLKFSSDRAILYANRAASKIKVERTSSAIHDCTKAVELNDKYLRAYLRRAKLYEDTEKLDESLEDYKKILELEPGNKEALNATERLPPLINERNEKLKTEMFGKLKDLGNLFLRPFGLSTDNFQLQQDPNSGGYSVNFSQNTGT